MKQFPFKKIDAFTAGGSPGNPAACVYLTEEASPEDMQRIARELKGFVSEVVYCLPAPEDGIDFSLRYYSSECEVAFCGHGTIACLYDLIVHDPRLRDRKEIMIRTSMGDLKVYNQIGAVDAVFISAPLPTFWTADTISPDDSPAKALGRAAVADQLGLTEKQMDVRLPLGFINAGLDTLIVPVRSLADILSIWPDESALKDFCIQNNVDIITVLTTDVGDPVHTRVFAPRFGYLEDPATGSGNSAVGYYLLRNGLWDGRPLSIEQGPGPIYNSIRLDSILLQGGDKQVMFGGAATVRIEGYYYI